MPGPDICLLDGRVFTVDANDAVTEALAVYGGRIVATGTTRAIRALAGAATRVIDLAGRVAFERG